MSKRSGSKTRRDGLRSSIFHALKDMEEERKSEREKHLQKKRLLKAKAEKSEKCSDASTSTKSATDNNSNSNNSNSNTVNVSVSKEKLKEAKRGAAAKTQEAPESSGRGYATVLPQTSSDASTDTASDSIDRTKLHDRHSMKTETTSESVEKAKQHENSASKPEAASDFTEKTKRHENPVLKQYSPKALQHQENIVRGLQKSPTASVSSRSSNELKSPSAEQGKKTSRAVNTVKTETVIKSSSSTSTSTIDSTASGRSLNGDKRTSSASKGKWKKSSNAKKLSGVNGVEKPSFKIVNHYCSVTDIAPEANAEYATCSIRVPKHNAEKRPIEMKEIPDELIKTIEKRSQSESAQTTDSDASQTSSAVYVSIFFFALINKYIVVVKAAVAAAAAAHQLVLS
uniref:Suppressor protein SRP40-like n=1 Tax=Syphacia muris TaxID=451379 RepID=A0A0N5AN28_9BILA